MNQEKTATLTQYAELLNRASEPNTRIVLMHDDGKRVMWSCNCGKSCESATPACLRQFTHDKTCDWYQY
jgi:hypothetical protein